MDEFSGVLIHPRSPEIAGINHRSDARQLEEPPCGVSALFNQVLAKFRKKVRRNKTMRLSHDDITPRDVITFTRECRVNPSVPEGHHRVGDPFINERSGAISVFNPHLGVIRRPVNDLVILRSCSIEKKARPVEDPVQVSMGESGR